MVGVVVGGVVVGGVVVGGVVVGGVVVGGVVVGGVVTGVVVGGVVAGGAVTGVVVGGVVAGGDDTVAAGVPREKGSFTKKGRPDTTAFVLVLDLVGVSVAPKGMRGRPFDFVGVVTVGVGVADPMITCSPFGSVVVVADADVFTVEAFPTKRMALRPATMMAPATMIDHRQNVSSPADSAATSSPHQRDQPDHFPSHTHRSVRVPHWGGI